MPYYSGLFMADPQVQDQGHGVGESAGVVDDSPPREGAPLHSDDSHRERKIKAERAHLEYVRGYNLGRLHCIEKQAREKEATTLEYVRGYNLGWLDFTEKQAREKEANHSISTPQVPGQEHGDAELGGLVDDNSHEDAQLHSDDLDGYDCYDCYQHGIEELERDLEHSFNQKYIHLVDGVCRPTEPIYNRQTKPVNIGQTFIYEPEQQFNQQFDEIERLCNRTQQFAQQHDEIESLRKVRQQQLDEIRRRRNRRQQFGWSNPVGSESSTHSGERFRSWILPVRSITPVTRDRPAPLDGLTQDLETIKPSLFF